MDDLLYAKQMEQLNRQNTFINDYAKTLLIASVDDC